MQKHEKYANQESSHLFMKCSPFTFIMDLCISMQNCTPAIVKVSHCISKVKVAIFHKAYQELFNNILLSWIFCSPSGAVYFFKQVANTQGDVL